MFAKKEALEELKKIDEVTVAEIENNELEKILEEREKQRQEELRLEHRSKFFEDDTPIVTSKTLWAEKDTLLLTFAGDIMAHAPNYSKGNFNKIYEGIEDILKESDLAFANLEAPVDDSKPYSTYPQFNMHSEYPQAAINAGFNVFSLANNHSNDKELSGIKATKAHFDTMQESTKNNERPFWASGLKDGKDSPYSYCVIERNGWKILFLAVTEILNTPRYSSYINYVKIDDKSRAEFCEYVSKLREENPCDLFVLSMHTYEPEYIVTITKMQTTYYHDLLKSGVDVLWANHPHVPRDWEIVSVTDDSLPSKAIFYGQGNTISAQRTVPSFSCPTLVREYTGDGIITQLRFLKDENGIQIVNVNPILITTYITPEKQFIIKKINDEVIAELRKDEHADWAKYLEDRRRLLQTTKGKITCQ